MSDAVLVQRKRWVMDGSGASTFDIRLPRTELVLCVRVPRRVALTGLAKRIMRSYGKVRPDMAAGCPEKLPDREFLSYIWNFEKAQTPKFIQNMDLYGPDVPVAILKSHREMDIMLMRTTIIAGEQSGDPIEFNPEAFKQEMREELQAKR